MRRIFNHCTLILLVSSLFATVHVSDIHADLIDTLSIHGATDPAPESVINSTDNSGTVNVEENTNRKVDNLFDRVGLNGPPYLQLSLSTTLQAYYNSQFIDTRGDLGILVDLGRIHRIDAMQLYGYNIVDAGGTFSARTPGNFSIWTATSDAAITTSGGALLVDDIAMFAQHGMEFGMNDPGASATTGETYLFGNAAQPPEVTDDEPDVVTAETVFARYIFLRDLEPIETNPADENIVGLAEVQFYGFSLGDINLDGSVNLLDVSPFIELLSGGEYNVFGDINFDGSVNLLDVQPFIDILTG